MTRHLMLIGAAAGALGLAACNREAATPEVNTAEQSATPDANPAATVASPANEAAAPDFVAKAAASDMFEIEASKLAQARSKNAEVKAFAAEMIKAHTASTEGLKKAIAESGQPLTPPAALPGDLQGKLDDLKAADAADFDKKFMDVQEGAHQDTLNIMQRYAEDGDLAPIKAFAQTTAPVVQHHLDEAKALKDKLG